MKTLFIEFMKFSLKNLDRLVENEQETSSVIKYIYYFKQLFKKIPKENAKIIT